MRKITNRQEYAKCCNFGTYPVLTIDMNQEGFMNVIFKGCNVRVDFGTHKGDRMLDKGELCYDIKDDKFYVSNYGYCLKNSFTYEDAIECANYANAPIIDNDMDVVIIKHNSKTREVDCYIAKAVHKKEFCSTMIEFE